MTQTGNQRLLEFLRDGRWYTTGELARACEVTVHSRVSDLRRLGHVIEKRTNHGQTGYQKFSYRLVQTASQRQLQDESLAELEAGSRTPAPTSSSASDCGRSSPPPAGPSSSLPPAGGTYLEQDGLEDAGWRELYDAHALTETLPPPVEQLELGVGS